MELTSEERRSYTVLIDDILANSDLQTVSEKKIRRTMAERLGKDISEQKAAISAIIMERFDNLNDPTPPESPEEEETIFVAPAKPKLNGHTHTHTNGNSHKVKKEVKKETLSSDEDDLEIPTPDEDDDISDIDDSPPKKKRKSQPAPVSDAKLAALLQAQENSRSRPSRSGVVKKAALARRKKSPKKKSASKVKADDDSDVELDSDGQKKAVVRTGGFHKEYHLSEPLVDLVEETKLSRPQVVKKIWAHIKANDLQDPSDKRQIRCDEKMQLVFKQDKVHMFTMNKLLGKHLYPIDEA